MRCYMVRKTSMFRETITNFHIKLFGRRRRRVYSNRKNHIETQSDTLLRLSFCRFSCIRNILMHKQFQLNAKHNIQVALHQHIPKLYTRNFIEKLILKMYKSTCLNKCLRAPARVYINRTCI